LTELTWIAIASVASAFAVILSGTSLYFQRKQFKNANEPLLLPGMKNVNVELPEIRFDWETKKKIDKKFSETKIPFINIGGGLAYDIHYHFELYNYRELIKAIDELKMFEDYYFELSCKSYENHEYDILVVEGESVRRFTHTQSYVRMLNPMKSGEEEELPLPSYFIVLTNAFLRHGNVLGFRHIETLPSLILNISYKTINNKKKEEKHIIKWSDRQRIKNITYKYQEGQYFDSDLIFNSIR